MLEIFVISFAIQCAGKFHRDYFLTEIYIVYSKSFLRRVSEGILDFFVVDRKGKSYDLTRIFAESHFCIVIALHVALYLRCHAQART